MADTYHIEAKPMPTPADIAARVHALADNMWSIAVDMEYYGGLSVWARHARELLELGYLARSWAIEITDTIEAVEPLTDIEQKCPDCLTPPGTRCESAPGHCPYRQAPQDAEAA